MRILTKLYGNTVLTETQQQEIRLLATTGSILAYTSDVKKKKSITRIKRTFRNSSVCKQCLRIS